MAQNEVKVVADIASSLLLEERVRQQARAFMPDVELDLDEVVARSSPGRDEVVSTLPAHGRLDRHASLASSRQSTPNTTEEVASSAPPTARGRLDRHASMDDWWSKPSPAPAVSAGAPSALQPEPTAAALIAALPSLLPGLAPSSLAGDFFHLGDALGGSARVAALRDAAALRALDEAVLNGNGAPAWASAAPPLPAHGGAAARRGGGALYAALRGLRACRLGRALHSWARTARVLASTVGASSLVRRVVADSHELAQRLADSQATISRQEERCESLLLKSLRDPAARNKGAQNAAATADQMRQLYPSDGEVARLRDQVEAARELLRRAAARHDAEVAALAAELGAADGVEAELRDERAATSEVLVEAFEQQVPTLSAAASLIAGAFRPSAPNTPFRAAEPEPAPSPALSVESPAAQPRSVARALFTAETEPPPLHDRISMLEAEIGFDARSPLSADAARPPPRRRLDRHASMGW